MKTIVYYYSHKGSNRYLAHKIAADLQCDIEEIKPRINKHLLMLMGVNFGNRKLKLLVSNYQRVILCGPIWMGKLIVPLKNFINKHFKNITTFIFVTCCGSTYEKKDEKFGHNLVFTEVKAMLGEKCTYCQAFPITLVLPPEQKDDTSAFMKTHLNDSNFTEEISQVYNHFMAQLKQSRQ